MNTYIRKPLRYVPRGTQFILEDVNAKRRQNALIWIKGTCFNLFSRIYARCHVAGDSKRTNVFDCNRTVFVIEKDKNKRYWSRKK